MLTFVAALVVWAALVAPIQPWRLTPGSFVRLPLEGLVVIALAVALPTRARRFVPWLIGPLLGVLVLLKLLDLGFFVAFDRPFNPVEDWSYLSIGVGTVRVTFGGRDADLAVVAAVVLVLTALVVPALAVGQLTQVGARHRRRSLQTVAALAALWVLCWMFGAEVSGAGIASLSAARLAVSEVHAVRADLRDQARFRALIDRKDPSLDTPPSQLLEGLRGKDVLLVFVESYGQMAVQGTSFSPGIDAIVTAGTRALQADGFSSRSGWLTSSTFGGGSWLAHGTLESGTWINSPSRYSALIASKRLTLPAAFRRAGWRTVADVPSTHGSWPEGTSFYRFEKIWDRDNLGYRGPSYGFSAMPDQYTFQALQKLELAKRDRPPIFAEIDTTSSHEPWTRIPPLISWDRLGDGSIFNRLPINRTGLTDTQQGYAKSIQYSLRVLYSFIERYGTKNTVLIVLGDHQPSRVIGGHPGHQVPITIIAHDPKVISRLSSWDWTNGMLPELVGTGLADERLPGPLPRGVRRLGAAGPGGEECGPEEQLGPGQLGQPTVHGGANRLPRTARHPLVYRPEGPHNCDPELGQPPRRVVRSLEIQHGPASAVGEGRGAAGDDISAFRHLRQGVRGQDRVHRGLGSRTRPRRLARG